MRLMLPLGGLVARRAAKPCLEPRANNRATRAITVTAKLGPSPDGTLSLDTRAPYWVPASRSNQAYSLSGTCPAPHGSLTSYVLITWLLAFILSALKFHSSKTLFQLNKMA